MRARFRPCVSFVLFTAIGSALVACGSGEDDSADDNDVAEGALERRGVYECTEREPRGVSARLIFDRDENLKSVVLSRIPYRGFPDPATLQTARGETTIGSNAEQQFTNFTWPIETTAGNLDAQVSYLTKVKEGDKWKSVPLSDSLLGDNRAVNGEAYGKLRVDITIPDVELEGRAGSSYFLYCEKM